MSKSVITVVRTFIILAIIFTVVTVICVVSGSLPKKAPNFTFDYLEKHHFEKYNKFVLVDEYDTQTGEAYVYNRKYY